jgi:hypothetical protein
MPETTIYCSSRVKDLWPSPLADQWAAEYPQLFDADDIRLAKSQTRYHFVEWFAAIHLFQRDGVRALVEKYVFRTHPIKQQLLTELLGSDGVEPLHDIRRAIGAQPPDLLLHESGRLVGFAEVKGPGDRLSEKQRLTHLALKRQFGVSTEIINVRLRS